MYLVRNCIHITNRLDAGDINLTLECLYSFESYLFTENFAHFSTADMFLMDDK